MTSYEEEKFPCTSCGQCCRLVHLSEQTAYLDRGDGVCRYFDEKSRLCKVYESRPLVCNIKQYYLTHLSTTVSWNEFVKVNWTICEQLSSQLDT